MFFRERSVSGEPLNGGPVVPPLTWSCSSDTRFASSARQICCFSRYTHSMSFRISSVPGEPLDSGFRRATTYMVMFSWYQDWIDSETDLLFREIYRLKIYFKNRIYHEHRSTGGLPVNPIPLSCSPQKWSIAPWGSPVTPTTKNVLNTIIQPTLSAVNNISS